MEKKMDINPANFNVQSIKKSFVCFLQQFRLWMCIWKKHNIYPYYLAGSGSGSTSGNVDLDPGSKK